MCKYTAPIHRNYCFQLLSAAHCKEHPHPIRGCGIEPRSAIHLGHHLATFRFVSVCKSCVVCVRRLCGCGKRFILWTSFYLYISYVFWSNGSSLIPAMAMNLTFILCQKNGWCRWETDFSQIQAAWKGRWLNKPPMHENLHKRLIDIIRIIISRAIISSCPSQDGAILTHKSGEVKDLSM